MKVGGHFGETSNTSKAWPCAPWWACHGNGRPKEGVAAQIFTKMAVWTTDNQIQYLASPNVGVGAARSHRVERPTVL